MEPDVTVFTNEISYRPKENQSTFQYAVAADYENTLVELLVRDQIKFDGYLIARRVETPDYVADVYAKNLTDYLWFEVDISEAAATSRDGLVHLEVKEYFKRRREAFPESIATTEMQTLQF